MRTFDVIVIGGGPAGEVAAGALGERGLAVALIEEHLVGGECSFYACMPSKSLLRPGEALHETRRIPGAAEAVTGRQDVQATLDRRDEVIHDLDDTSQVPWLEQRAVTLIRGSGKLTGERRVQVGEEQLEATRAVVLATGSDALLPPIDGLAQADPWISRDATTAKRIPPRLVIIGGGVVGVEMAQAYQELGSQVTLIEGERHVLPREEVFACELVSDALTELGVDIRNGAKAQSVARGADRGPVTVTLQDGSTAEGDELLVAVGRRPRAGGLGLEALGVAVDAPLEIDAHMRVAGQPWLYAIGDVNSRALFTHMGKYQARVAAAHILGRAIALEHGADGPLSPRVVFTDPQVAAVGHTTATAGRAGLDVQVVDVETSGNAGGSFYGRNAPGTTRFLVDSARRVLVGATFTGAEVGEFLHAATIAIVGEVPLDRLRHAVPCFPTRSELWLQLPAETA